MARQANVPKEQIKVHETLATYTAKYTKLRRGFMGQLLEWPEVITEGKDLEDCRASLKDALAGNDLGVPRNG